jgi:hypothetical protein
MKVQVDQVVVKKNLLEVLNHKEKAMWEAFTASVRSTIGKI